MPSFHYRHRTPKSLTAQEATALLRVTGERVAGQRDHVLYSLALGTGLRQHELAALDWEHVLNAHGGIRERVPLPAWKGRGRAGKAPGRAPEEPQEAFLPPDCRRKLAAFARAQGPGRPSGPVFGSREGGRLSTRAMRAQFAVWQRAAGFERRISFHALRHTYCRAVLAQAGGNLLVVQRAARHRNLQTTAIYLDPSDEDVARACRRL